MDGLEAIGTWLDYMKGYFVTLLSISALGVVAYIAYRLKQRREDEFWAEQYRKQYGFETSKEEVEKALEEMHRPGTEKDATDTPADESDPCGPKK